MKVLVMDEGMDAPLVFSGLLAFRIHMKQERDLPDEVLNEVAEEMSKPGVKSWGNAAATFFWVDIITTGA